jgi:hypothetical protein
MVKRRFNILETDASTKYRDGYAFFNEGLILRGRRLDNEKAVQESICFESWQTRIS